MRANRLIDGFPGLERLLTRGGEATAPQFAVSEIQLTTVWVSARDGVRLRTDLYLPPSRPAPAIVLRTPYGRAADAVLGALFSFVRRGYVVIAQDCRGTGESEPDSWDYYMYESEDSYDLVEWIQHQEWFGGFVGSCGTSYAGQTQWCMATHPAMSTIVPQVSGLGVACNTARLYMFLNAYARAIGKGVDKVSVHIADLESTYEQETLAGGYFNESLHEPFPDALLVRFPVLRTLPPFTARRWLWGHYCSLRSAQRAELVKHALGIKNVTSTDVEALAAIFGQQVPHDAHSLPHASPVELCRSIHAPPLLLTGWYDWGLNDALATWELLRAHARQVVGKGARMVIGPNAHNMPGYHENTERHPELMRLPNMASYAGLLLHWYQTVREGKINCWPAVIYYLMGANEWRIAANWPVPGARSAAFYLGRGGILTQQPPPPASHSESDQYTYDPRDPTPTVGGSILSFVYPPGSVDVRHAQQRPDVLVYSTPPLDHDIDVVGPVRMTLYASSSTVDTDFVARLSDVFPDGRAIQLQSGILRARYRNLDGEPELLEPGRIYRFEIDMWATANRFKAGHRLRVDLSSADFPHFDRNTNRGGEPGDPVSALQTIYRDAEHPSHLLISVLESCTANV